MFILQRLFLFVVFVSFLAGCKKKKTSLSGNDKVEITDFMDAFDPLPLPYRLTDSLVMKRDADSTAISHAVISQFVPDSIFSKTFGKGIRVKVYPIGKTGIDKKEVYLLAKIVQGTKKAAFLLCFDKDNHFTGHLTVLVPDQNESTKQSALIEKNFTVTKIIERKNDDGSVSEGKDAFVFNAESKSFTLIMTDALDDKPAEVINPIDTLPKKNKLSGDYVKSKTDYISFRDPRKGGKFPFFIHFERNNGECTGELKGEATMTSPTTAVYNTGGDPCIIQFHFSTGMVTMKESEGCGSHRGLRCLFDGSYPRKKEVKKKEARKKKPSLK